MIDNVRNFKEAAAYSYECPDGTWAGILDHKAWGHSRNLILYFTQAGSKNKYHISAFQASGYTGRDPGSHNMRNDAEPGDYFEITTARTANGKPYLAFIRKFEPNGTPGVLVAGAQDKCAPK